MTPTTANPGNYVVELNSTHKGTAKARDLMTKHLEEYVQFYFVCSDKPSIDKEEIPLLWTTWCIRRGTK